MWRFDQISEGEAGITDSWNTKAILHVQRDDASTLRVQPNPPGTPILPDRNPKPNKGHGKIPQVETEKFHLSKC